MVQLCADTTPPPCCTPTKHFLTAMTASWTGLLLKPCDNVTEPIFLFIADYHKKEKKKKMRLMTGKTMSLEEGLEEMLKSRSSWLYIR